MGYPFCLVLTVVWVVLGIAIQPVMAKDHVLRDHVPAAVRSLTAFSPLPATTRLNLSLALPVRDEAGLDALLGQIYDPNSPHYHQYITPAEFATRFGATEADYQSVIHFARTNGFTITGTHANHLIVDVSGSTADINRAFHLTLKQYHHPTETRDFYAPDSDPVLDAAMPIRQVSGLNNFSSRITHYTARPLPKGQSQATPRVGSASAGMYIGNDFRNAFVHGTALNGAGQSIALLEYDGYYSNDITTYEQLAGLPGISLTNIPFGGGVSTPSSSGDVEVSLDIEVAMAMAPGLSRIIVYEAPNNNTVAWSSYLTQIADDNLARQISCSWGENTPAPIDSASETAFMQMASQGQSFFNASGDSDAFTAGIPFPSESTNITEVGGTTLYMNGNGGSYSSETAWNRTGGVGTCGGVSSNFTLPFWQQGIDLTASMGSTNFRNVPDVSMPAENIFVVEGNGSEVLVGGTSCAAPLWAGFLALVNQEAATYGKPSAGLINPVIYAIGKSPAYSSCFNDVAAGNNFKSTSPGLFPAVTGYDLCTGWGSPNGVNLINALASVSDSLVVSPFAGFSTNVLPGVIFTPISQTLVLTNTGSSPLTWAITNPVSWLTASATNGTLAAFGSTRVTVKLNPAGANNLSIQNNSAYLIIADVTSGIVQTRQFTANIVPAQLIVNGGFETGDFTGWTRSGNIGSSSYTAITTGSPSYLHSGSCGVKAGPLGSPGLISQTVATVPGQSYLLKFWYSNPAAGTPNLIEALWNGAVVFSQSNLGAIGWTGQQVIVTATDTNSTVELGFRNDPNYIGLDDISLIAVPAPPITVASAPGGVALGWNTVPGVTYQVAYQTNIANTNLVVLFQITAAANTLTFTNLVGSDPQRFYRVAHVP